MPTTPTATILYCLVWSSSFTLILVCLVSPLTRINDSWDLGHHTKTAFTITHYFISRLQIDPRTTLTNLISWTPTNHKMGRLLRPICRCRFTGVFPESSTTRSLRVYSAIQTQNSPLPVSIPEPRPHIKIHANYQREKSCVAHVVLLLKLCLRERVFGDGCRARKVLKMLKMRANGHAWLKFVCT